jgi:triacylglycerol esterase/lipase EstA (alpha/beta hydrolase family)
MIRRCILAGVTGVLIVVSLGATAGTSIRYPVNWDVITAMATGVTRPGVPPSGANIQGCRPNSQHPDPVVLVHGIFGNQNDYWQAMAPTLANAGYCVYTFTYGQTGYSDGIGGLTSLYASAQQLAAFIRDVLAQSNSKQVDIVGHSEGGLLPRVYMRYDDGAPYVHTFVAIAPPNNAPPSVSGLLSILELVPGSTNLVGAGCTSCGQMLDPGFYGQLNQGGTTYATVRYTVIVSDADEVVTPPQADSYLPTGPNVTNESVQNFCPRDRVGHLGEIYDSDIVQLVINALSPARATPIRCSSGFPF